MNNDGNIDALISTLKEFNKNNYMVGPPGLELRDQYIMSVLL